MSSYKRLKKAETSDSSWDSGNCLEYKQSYDRFSNDLSELAHGCLRAIEILESIENDDEKIPPLFWGRLQRTIKRIKTRG